MSVDAEYQTAADAAADLAGLQRLELVRRALDSLSSRHRHLLELVALDGVRQVTIAEDEGVAPEVIRSAVLRARQRFRVVHDRLLQEHGFLGAAGSLQSALARVRLRMVRIEPWVPRKAELAAAVLAGLLMSAPVHNTTDGRAENRFGVVEAIVRPVRLSGPEARAGGSQATGGQAVHVMTKLPGGSVEGDIELDGLEVPNTYWTASIAGLTVTVGTNGQHGRFVAGYTPPTQDVSSTTSTEVEVRCRPENVTAHTKCTILDLAEQQARSLD